MGDQKMGRERESKRNQHGEEQIDGASYKIEHTDTGASIRPNGIRKMPAREVFDNSELNDLTFLRKKGKAGS